jgi:nucleotide-binding universal stress UspA family protein
MRHRRPVLCAIDQSPEALAAGRLAGVLARELEVPLVLAHAVDLIYPTEGWTLLGGVPPHDHYEAQARERRHGEELLQRVVDRLHLPDGTQTLLLVGDPGKELLRAAASTHAVAVVVGAREHGGIRRAVLGSRSGGLAANAPCPVVVVRPGVGNNSTLMDGPFVCAVDGSAHAARGATVAAAAAQCLSRKLILVHVLPAVLVHDEAARRQGWTMLAAIACRIGTPARLMVEPETATIATTLANVASREGAACLMIGSHGRGPLRSAILGSVSNGVAAHSPCPVVVIPPESLPSPSTNPPPATVDTHTHDRELDGVNASLASTP